MLADGWSLEYPKWRDLYKRPHQHLGWPVMAQWFLSNTFSWCPTVDHDICPLRPSIGSSFCVFCLGRGVRCTPLGTLRFISSTVARQCEWIEHRVGPLILLTFTEILRFVKGRRWSICWPEGTEVSCQRRGFGLNIKHVFFCSVEMARFSS